MDNRTFGYARVSSKEQHEDRQIEALTNFGVSKDNIIADKCSGKDTEREGYQYLKKQILRSGDTLVIKELDRLSRNKADIKKSWNTLRRKAFIFAYLIYRLRLPTFLLSRCGSWI